MVQTQTDISSTQLLIPRTRGSVMQQDEILLGELQWHFGGDSLNLFQSSREKSIVEENYYNLTSILQCNKF